MNRTPEQKARDIYDAMKGFKGTNAHRKKCALFAVNEIIQTRPLTEIADKNSYWYQVKERIKEF